MPDKNEELNEAEMEQASGGGTAPTGGVEASRTQNRTGREGSVEGDASDPLGGPSQTEPGGMGGQVKS